MRWACMDPDTRHTRLGLVLGRSGSGAGALASSLGMVPMRRVMGVTGRGVEWTSGVVRGADAA